MVSTFVIAAYFTQGIAPDPATGQAQWGWMQALAGLGIALLSPVLGAVADAGGRRRAMLGALHGGDRGGDGPHLVRAAGPGLDAVGAGLRRARHRGLRAGDGVLQLDAAGLAPADRIGRVSGLAWGLGYAGGLACLAVALLLLVQPDPSPFGLDRGEAEHVRATALLTAAWVALFGWPVLLALPDPRGVRPGWGEAARAGCREIAGVLRALPRRPALARFLVARLFYTDGLNTLFAFGAIYAAGVFGMGFEEILVFGIALNVTAGLGAAGFGLVEDRVGSRRMVLVALARDDGVRRGAAAGGRARPRSGRWRWRSAASSARRSRRAAA